MDDSLTFFVYGTASEKKQLLATAEPNYFVSVMLNKHKLKETVVAGGVRQDLYGTVVLCLVLCGSCSFQKRKKES